MSLSWGGWLQGLAMLDAARPFMDSVTLTIPYLKWRSIGGVRLLSISFDGAHDTPAALSGYAGSWKADPGRWQFVRVPDPGEQATLLRQLGVVVIPDGRGDFEHNAALLILDAEGRMVRIFDVEERELALNYARHLARKQCAGDRS